MIRFPPPTLVEVSCEDEHVPDRLFGDARGVNATRVCHGDAVFGEGLDGNVLGAGERAGEEFEILGPSDERFVDRNSGRDPCLLEEFSFFLRRPRVFDSA